MSRTRGRGITRRVTVKGRRTSLRLEPDIWDALEDIARRQKRSVAALVTEIDQEKAVPTLTAAIRLTVVRFYRALSVCRDCAPPLQAAD